MLVFDISNAKKHLSRDVLNLKKFGTHNQWLSNMKAYRKMCYNFNEFFILFSLIPLSVSSSFFFLKHRSVPSYFLIPSYFPPTPTPNPTPTHQFHIDADADANANASLPHRSLSNCEIGRAHV